MAKRPPADLLEVLQEIQREQGSIRFDRFMEAVLYHPRFGYFHGSSERAGRSGDFLTSPEVSPLFGATVAAWCHHVADRLGTTRIDIIEAGAGKGTLCRSMQAADPLGRFRFHLVEASSAARASLEGSFGGSTVRVHAEVAELAPEFEAAVFLSNELFDNLPVRRIMRAGGLKEIHVRLERGRFKEVLQPCPPDLERLAEAQGVRPREGQSAEVNDRAAPLLAHVLSRIRSGGLLAFDYGGEAHEVSGDLAPHGTLVAHRGHATHPDLYDALGKQDISAHVNFTPLMATAKAHGFQEVRLRRQSQFLVDNGFAERFVAQAERAADPFERLRLSQYAKQLYHPEAMGDAFRVLEAFRPPPTL